MLRAPGVSIVSRETEEKVRTCQVPVLASLSLLLPDQFDTKVWTAELGPRPRHPAFRARKKGCREDSEVTLKVFQAWVDWRSPGNAPLIRSVGPHARPSPVLS